MKVSVFTAVVFVCLVLEAVGQTAKHPGIVYYEQGRYSDAIDSLTAATKSKDFKNSAEIWHFLGLAHLAKDNVAKAVKALEKSTDLAESNPVYHTNLAWAYLVGTRLGSALAASNEAVRRNPENPSAYMVRAMVYLRLGRNDPATEDADRFQRLAPEDPRAYKLQASAAKARLTARLIAGARVKQELPLLKSVLGYIERGVEVCRGRPECSGLEADRTELGAFLAHFETQPQADVGSGAEPAAPDPSVTPLRITRKPQAMYTDSARARGIEGSIRVLAILGASGKVESVLLLTSLGSGLDEQVMEAARAIKFEPKKRNGKAVSSIVELEYTFDIY